MMPITIPEVLRELETLPAARIAEVYDFVLFLKTRQHSEIDESDEWTEADMRDAAAASLRYADQTLTGEVSADGAG